MMTRFHIYRTWFGACPFEIKAGPSPEIEIGINVRLALWDDDGGGKESLGEEVGGYGGAKGGFAGVGGKGCQGFLS